MNKTARISRLVVIVCGFMFCAKFGFSADDDLQYWSAYNFKFKVYDNISLFINPSVRINDDVSDLFYWESRQGVTLKATDYFDFGLHYVYAREKDFGDPEWIDEHRLEIQPNFKWTIFGLDMSDRNRFDYRSIEGEEKWRYRNRIKIGKDLSVSDFEFSPYIYQEFFYDFKKDEYNQNRAGIGVVKQLTDTVSLDVYYQLRNDKDSDGHWSNKHIIGTTLAFSF